MPQQFSATIPLQTGTSLTVVLGAGQSITIIGANGSGKTRLGVHLEESMQPRSVHRIAAQKSLALSDNISLISFERAVRQLLYGNPDGQEMHRKGSRWGSKPATHLLSDFDALQQTLFADHNRVASQYLRDSKVDPTVPVPTTKLEELKNIWDGLLPHRVLEILDASIKVLQSPEGSGASYPGSEMSDGERAIFYFLGQCLVAPRDSAIVIDEPEVHVHKAILGLLWAAVEKARPDCGFVYITHDLDFAITHPSSTTYFIRAYSHSPQQWDIAEIPSDTGLSESVVAELVGSRRPILFVEGERSSLDLTLYRNHYDGFTIMPVGGCEAVIHAVASYRASAALHWLRASGLVDADQRDEEAVQKLRTHDIYVLPVAEVENLLLLPDVFHALAEAFYCDDPAAQVASLNCAILTQASTDIDPVSARHTTRELDRRLKRVRLEAKDLESLQRTYQRELGDIDPEAIFATFQAKLRERIDSRDIAGVLELYDNKGLVAHAAKLLGLSNKRELIEKMGRLLGGDKGAGLRKALEQVLPAIPV